MAQLSVEKAVDVYNRDISDAIELAEEHLEDAHNAEGMTREQHVLKAKQELKRSKTSARELKSFLRHHPELCQRKVAMTRKVLKSLEAAQNKLSEKICGFESCAGYGEVRGADVEMSDQDPSRAEAWKLAGEVTKHQKTTVKSIEHTLNLIHETEQVGENLIYNLMDQGEQLDRVDDDLDELGTDVKRARKELNAFARRMASDRLVLCCMFLVIVGGLLAIVLHFVMPAEDTGNNGIPPAEK